MFKLPVKVEDNQLLRDLGGHGGTNVHWNACQTSLSHDARNSVPVARQRLAICRLHTCIHKSHPGTQVNLRFGLRSQI